MEKITLKVLRPFSNGYQLTKKCWVWYVLSKLKQLFRYTFTVRCFGVTDSLGKFEKSQKIQKFSITRWEFYLIDFSEFSRIRYSFTSFAKALINQSFLLKKTWWKPYIFTLEVRISLFSIWSTDQFFLVVVLQIKDLWDPRFIKISNIGCFVDKIYQMKSLRRYSSLSLGCFHNILEQIWLYSIV